MVSSTRARRAVLATAGVLAFAVVAAARWTTAARSPIAAPADDWRAANDAWRATREASLRDPDGWLAVAGLFFLKPGVNSVGAAPGRDVQLPAGPADAGRVVVDGTQARFEPAPGVAATLNQRAITGPVALRLSDPDAKRAADRVAIGRVVIHLHRSGERLAIRLRDPESALRTGFRGLRWFPIEDRWRVAATFTRFAAPRPVAIANVLGDVDDVTSPGEAVFTAGGREVRLLAFDEGDQLWFVFTDATAGEETYETRFLYADKPDAAGRVVLDFNRAYNPPCAYNPHTTCPLPVPQNRLRIPIRAGERRYVGAARGGQGRAVRSVGAS